MNVTTAVTQDVRRNARIVAALMMLVGGAAILLPFTVGFATAIIIGVAIALAGAVGLMISRRAGQAGYLVATGPYWFYLVIGVMLALMPQVTLGLAAFALGFFFLMVGINGFRAANTAMGGGQFNKVRSGVSIALGIIIVLSGASGTAWLIGLCIGISLLIQGITLWTTVSRSPVIIEGN